MLPALFCISLTQLGGGPQRFRPAVGRMNQVISYHTRGLESLRPPRYEHQKCPSSTDFFALIKKSRISFKISFEQFSLYWVPIHQVFQRFHSILDCVIIYSRGSTWVVAGRMISNNTKYEPAFEIISLIASDIFASKKILWRDIILQLTHSWSLNNYIIVVMAERHS